VARGSLSAQSTSKIKIGAQETTVKTAFALTFHFHLEIEERENEDQSSC